MESKWKYILAAGGLVAGGAALCYILQKKDSKEDRARDADAAGPKKEEAKPPSPDEITKEQVMQILQEIIKSQELMKEYMKELTKELISKSMTFDQTYQKIKKVQPPDPLDKYGLSMMKFDQLLEKYQGDSGVRDSIAKIMGVPNPNSIHNEKVQSITVNTIIDVHTFMLDELNTLVKDFQDLPNKDTYDNKTVTIVAQALVGSKIEAKFDITSEDIESAVLMYHTMLATNQEFAAINIKIQHTMGKLIGSAFNQG